MGKTKQTHVVLLCISLLAVIMLCAPAIGAEQSTQTPTSDDPLACQQPLLIFEPATTPILQWVQSLVIQDSDKLQARLDEIPIDFIHPINLQVKVKECGEDDTHYVPKTQEITLCLEDVGNWLDTFHSRMKSIKPKKAMYKQVRQRLRWQLHYTLYHEIAHALIHQLKLPVLGREEDAADSLAVMALLGHEDDGPQAVLSVAEDYRLTGLQEIKDGDVSWWDEHAVNLQRSYNMLCLVYGHKPKEHKYLVGSKRGRLPKTRAERCTREFRQSAQSWITLLKPHEKPSSEDIQLATPAMMTPAEPQCRLPKDEVNICSP